MLYYLTFDGSLGEDVASLLLCFLLSYSADKAELASGALKPKRFDI